MVECTKLAKNCVHTVAIHRNKSFRVVMHFTYRRSESLVAETNSEFSIASGSYLTKKQGRQLVFLLRT